MRVSDAWLVYIVTVLVVYIGLTLVNCRLEWTNLTRFVASFLAGLVAVLLVIPNVTAVTETDRTFYTVLLLTAIIIPIALALWMAWKRNMIPGLSGGEVDAEGCQTKEEYSCDGDACNLVQSTRKCPGRDETYLYGPRTPGRQTTPGRRSVPTPRRSVVSQ